MKLIHNNTEKLYDGLGDPLYKEKKEFTIKGYHKTFKIWDLVKNKFKNLKDIFSEEEFNQIVITSSNTYRSKESNLGLYYILDDNYLLIFSHGEKQPARYQLFLEAVYTLDE
ncbi:hypothetical protein [Kordia sp.]|uniref:hypothetical protein n=1 Tax=Kordia sp. TaxID=1965332 RepID=UPI003D2C47B0